MKNGSSLDLALASFLSLIFSIVSSILITFCNIPNIHHIFCDLCSSFQILFYKDLISSCSPEFPCCFVTLLSISFILKAKKEAYMSLYSFDVPLSSSLSLSLPRTLHSDHFLLFLPSQL